MRINNTTDPKDVKPDYFDGDDIEETKKEQQRRYREDDPRYWEEEDGKGEWDHLRPLFRLKIWLMAGALAVVALLVGFVYIHWFRPYATGGVQYGYVEDVQKQGSLFRTYEGVMLPYRNLMDTVRTYRGDFVFSAANDKIAAELHKASSACRPVRVEYVRYSATLPWRGDSRYVVTSVSYANPDLILPPDRRPRR